MDRRAGIHDTAIGLRTPEEAARQILVCGAQLCQQLMGESQAPRVARALEDSEVNVTCGGIFESDSERAKATARLSLDKTLDFVVPHRAAVHTAFAGQSDTMNTLAAMLALAVASQKAILFTS